MTDPTKTRVDKRQWLRTGRRCRQLRHGAAQVLQKRFPSDRRHRRLQNIGLNPWEQELHESDNVVFKQVFSYEGCIDMDRDWGFRSHLDCRCILSFCERLRGARRYRHLTKPGEIRSDVCSNCSKKRLIRWLFLVHADHLWSIVTNFGRELL